MTFEYTINGQTRICLVQGHVAGTCEHGNENEVFHKIENLCTSRTTDSLQTLLHGISYHPDISVLSEYESINFIGASRCVISNVVLYYSIYKHNINYKITKFSINYMATCFGYIVAILRPTQNDVQVHNVRTQWDPVSFTTRTYTFIKQGVIL